MRLLWATDVHLNFLDRAARAHFARTLATSSPDACVLTGDISEAPVLATHLRELADALQIPVYFVLGNHDFYRGSVHALRDEMRALTSRSAHLRWLPAVGVVPLTREVALVGHDGWADGRAGDYWGSTVRLNDDLLIDELRVADRGVLRATLERYGDEAASYLTEVAQRALETHARVYVATHVPPFREACWHEGAISSDAWLPRFTCVAVGEALRDVMRACGEDRAMNVLCGHTHSPGVVRPLANLVVHTGGAKYGAPALAGCFDL